MTIKELIDEGSKIRLTCTRHLSAGKEVIEGANYDKWLERCSRFLQVNYPNDPQVAKFVTIANNGRAGYMPYYNNLMGILAAIDEIPMQNDNSDSFDCIIEYVCRNFHRCVKSLQDRYSERNTLEINDEYDVQDLLRSIMRLFVDDVRPEDYISDCAGGKSRVDFNLPAYDTFIETKMIREGLDDKKLGEELAIDIKRYSKGCKKLIFFIYDKNNELKNPSGIITDIENSSTDELSVKVYISPL